MRFFRSFTPSDRRAARLVGPKSCASDAPTGVTGIEALERVLAAYEHDRLLGRGRAREADRALRAAARVLAAESRAQDPARAERLVIDLKRRWSTLLGGGLTSSAANRALWDRVVTLCCEEFYAPSLASAPAAPSAPAATRSVA